MSCLLSFTSVFRAQHLKGDYLLLLAGGSGHHVGRSTALQSWAPLRCRAALSWAAIQTLKPRHISVKTHLTQSWRSGWLISLFLVSAIIMLSWQDMWKMLLFFARNLGQIGQGKHFLSRLIGDKNRDFSALSAPLFYWAEMSSICVYFTVWYKIKWTFVFSISTSADGHFQSCFSSWP